MATSKITKPRLCVSTVGILSLTGKTSTPPWMNMKSKLKNFFFSHIISVRRCSGCGGCVFLKERNNQKSNAKIWAYEHAYRQFDLSSAWNINQPCDQLCNTRTWVAPLMVWSLAVTHCKYQSFLFSIEFCPMISNVKSRTVIVKSMNFDLKTNIIYPQRSHFLQ